MQRLRWTFRFRHAQISSNALRLGNNKARTKDGGGMPPPSAILFVNDQLVTGSQVTVNLIVPLLP